MKQIKKLRVKYHNQPVGTLSFTPDSRLCVFEYSPEWIASGFSISPLELPLRSGVFIAKPFPFKGNFGIFEDSLPDGYGRYLLRKALLKEGINDNSLTALDRLAIVGEGGMGALTYCPAIEVIRGEEITDFDFLQEKALEVLKEYQDNDAHMLLYNSGNSGGARPKAVFKDDDGHWLIKFRHTYDPKNIGKIEFQYNDIARKCGINIPEFKLIEDKYFATKRFDISRQGDRIHVATAGALLSVSHSDPILDYSNLLALTGWLTQKSEDVEEMFRRMIFNYLTDNKDDHSKNFAFIVDKYEEGKYRWRLAPAYDLTLCENGFNGQHATSVNGTGYPTLKDFIEVGTKIKIPSAKCRSIIDEVYTTCAPLRRYPLTL